MNRIDVARFQVHRGYSRCVDTTAFSLRRWLDRFKTEDRVVADQRASGRAPGATLDEVGTPVDNVSWSGRPLRSKDGNGHGSGDPSTWAGWGGGSSGF